MIPLGILATTAGGGAAAGAYEFIETINGTGSTGTITFSSVPSTYKHLQVRFISTLTSDSGGNMSVRLNGDTSTSYTNHFLYAYGSGMASTSNSPRAFMQIFGDYAGQSTLPTAGIMDILNYADTSGPYKTVRAFCGTVRTSPSEVVLASGAYLGSTSAISSITMYTNSGTFATSARFSLFGIKG